MLRKESWIHRVRRHIWTTRVGGRSRTALKVLQSEPEVVWGQFIVLYTYGELNILLNIARMTQNRQYSLNPTFKAVSIADLSGRGLLYTDSVFKLTQPKLRNGRLATYILGWENCTNFSLKVLTLSDTSVVVLHETPVKNDVNVQTRVHSHSQWLRWVQSYSTRMRWTLNNDLNKIGRICIEIRSTQTDRKRPQSASSLWLKIFMEDHLWKIVPFLSKNLLSRFFSGKFLSHSFDNSEEGSSSVQYIL